MPLFKRKKKDSVPAQGSVTSLNSVESAASKEMLGQPCVYETPKVKDQPQLHRAVWKENLNKLKSSAKSSNINSLDKQNRTALHVACAKGLDEFIVHLVTVCRADPNIADKDGCTPVHRLIEGGHSRCLQTVLDGGNVKLGLSNKKGYTALHFAAENGDATAVQKLVTYENMPIDAINKEGHSALHLASYGGYQEVVHVLLEGGANPDVQDPEGRTSLMYACSVGQSEVVKLLCDYSVDFEIKDNIGDKALSYAVEGGHQECVTALEEHQKKLEREAENAASASPLPPEPGAVQSSNPQSRKASMIDGKPAVGFTNMGKNHSYTPITEADPDTLNDSWAPSDMEEEIPKRPSLLAEGMNIMRTKEREPSKTVKIDSSATVPMTNTNRTHLDSIMSAPVTQISVSGRQPTNTREGLEYASSVPKTQTKSSIKTTQTAAVNNNSGYPDWFSFQDYGTDESEDHSNLSDLLRESNHPPSQLAKKTKESSAKKLVDEAASLSSPEMVRNKEKIVRYAMSQPTQPVPPTSPRKSHNSITSASPSKIPAEKSSVTTALPLGEEQHVTDNSPHYSQHSAGSRSNLPPYLSSATESKPLIYKQISSPPVEPSFVQGPAASTQTSPRISQENPSMKGMTTPVHQYESSSGSSHSPEHSSPRRHTFPSVHPYAIQPLPSQPEPSTLYECTMQPHEHMYTSGTAVSSQGRSFQHIYTSGAQEVSQGSVQHQGSPVGSQGNVQHQGSPVGLQRSVATQGTLASPRGSVLTQGMSVGPQKSAQTQGSPMGPWESKMTSVSRVTYPIPPDESVFMPPVSSAQQSPRMLSQGLHSMISQENPIVPSGQGSTLPLKDYKPEGMDILAKKDGSTFSKVVKASNRNETSSMAELPLQSTMLSQTGCVQPKSFHSYLGDIQKANDRDTEDCNPKKKLTFATIDKECAHSGDLLYSTSQPTPSSGAFISTSYTGPSYTGTGNHTNKVSTSATYPIHSYLTSTALPSSSGTFTHSVGSPIYTGSPINTTYNKASVQEVLTKSPVYTYKSPLTTTSQTGMAAQNSNSMSKSPTFTIPGNSSYTTKLDIDLGLHKSYSFSSSSCNEDSPTLPDVKSSLIKSPRHKSGSRSASPTRTFVTNISIQNRGRHKGKSSKDEYNLSFDSSGKIVSSTPRSSTSSGSNSPSLSPRPTSTPEYHNHHSRKRSSEHHEHKPGCKLHGSSPGKKKHVTLADSKEGKTNSSEKTHSSRHKRTGSCEQSPKEHRRRTSKDDGAKTSNKNSKSSSCPVHGKVGASDETTPMVAKEQDRQQESPRPNRLAGYSEQQEPIAGHSINEGKDFLESGEFIINTTKHHQTYPSNSEELDPPIAGISFYSVSSTKGRRMSSVTSDKDSKKERKSRESSREKQNRKKMSIESETSTSRKQVTDKLDGGDVASEEKKTKHRSRRSRSVERRSRSRESNRSTSGSNKSMNQSRDKNGERIRDRSKKSKERSESMEASEIEDLHENTKEHNVRSQSGSRRTNNSRSLAGSHEEKGHRRSRSGNQILMVDTKFATVDANGVSSISESYLHSSYGQSSSVRTSISCDPALLGDASAQPVEQMESDTSQTTLETCHIHEERSNAFSGQYEELCVTKSRLEQRVLQAELDLRELKYSIQQRDETIKVNKVLQEQLRDHIKKLEERLGYEVESRESAELKAREYELEERTKTIALQQIMEKEQQLRGKLQAETDARQLQEGLYHEQVRVFQALQIESTKCQVYQTDLEKKLHDANGTKMELETHLASATSDLSVLKEEIAAIKHRGSLTESAYEDELANLKEQLKALEDKNTEIVQNRVDMKTTFEHNLEELHRKAQFLNDGLVTEKERRALLEKENASVKADRDELFAQHQETISLAKEREHSLCQKLEEKIREGSIKDCELKNTREHLSTQKARLEFIEAQMVMMEKALKTSEQESSQRAHKAASLEQTCQQLQDNVCRLEEYSRGLEKRSKEMDAKFESVSNRTNTLEVEKERLLQQADFSRLKLEEMEALRKELHGKVEELTEANQQDRAKILDLQAKYKSEHSQRILVEESLSDAKRKLTASQTAMYKAETELKELQKKIVAMEHDLGTLSNQDSLNRVELNAGQIRETQMNKEIQHLVEMRKALEGAMSEKQQEIVRLQDQLNKTISIRDSASKEAEELRNLWEAEVKTKARLTQKVIEMETALAESKAVAGTAVDTEKRRAKKACESKKALESRLETLQAYYSNMEGEMTRVKAELRVSKVHLKKMHQKEKLLSTLHGGFEEEKAGLLKEKGELRNMLEYTREQLKLEGEAKLQAQLNAAKAREDLDLSFSRLKQEHGEVTMKDKEVNRLVQVNQQLQEEITSFRNMMADYNLCKRDLEGHKKEVQEKARTELMQKLEEVNCHMDQQSQVQESLIKMHQEKEAEWRSKYNQAQDLVRQLQSQIKMDIESKNLENARLKSKLQREIQNTEKLASQVQRSQEDVKQCKARLNLEKSRTEQLLKVSHKVTSSSPLARADVDHTHISPDHGVHHTSLNSTTTMPAQDCDGVQYQSLLCSVRAQLDQSISRHLDSAHVSVTTKEVSGSGSKARPELDSIQRNYHI